MDETKKTTTLEIDCAAMQHDIKNAQSLGNGAPVIETKIISAIKMKKHKN